ncbi:hypothetical protein [Nocardia harenae]|uniref:hypothetical protein n=1 Tax=Nocardia harenae TaxID=358707 RepID=UPI000A475C7E|nr:hypothetical protein [Nocardia harenae]
MDASLRTFGRWTLPLLASALLLLGCGTQESAVTVTTEPPAPSESPQDRNLRIREQLLQLGCTTNSCLQTYFACQDGTLTGDPCLFYREHPLP